MRKPFSPLTSWRRSTMSSRSLKVEAEAEGADQLLAYARDLSRLAQVERRATPLWQDAYRR